MKRLIVILLFISAIQAYGQGGWPATDSIQVSEITGSDTTLFLGFRRIKPISIQFEWTNLSHTDAILLPAYSNTDSTYTNVDATTYPLTLTQTASSDIEQSIVGTDTTYCHTIIKDNWNAKYLVIKFTKGSCTSGALKYIWHK